MRRRGFEPGGVSDSRPMSSRMRLQLWTLGLFTLDLALADVIVFLLVLHLKG